MGRKELDRALKSLFKEYGLVQKMMMGIEPINNIKRWEFVQMLYDYGQRLRKRTMRNEPRGIGLAEKLYTPEARQKLQDLIDKKYRDG